MSRIIVRLRNLDRETALNSLIDRVEIFGVAVPLAGEYKNAYLSKVIQKSAIVRITTSSGVVGLGNIDPSPGYSAETIEESIWVLNNTLGPQVRGMDATNVHLILQRMNLAVAGYLDAKAAIEMACVDAAARISNVSVHTYLGGAIRNVLLFNAWVGILPPDEAAAQTLAWQKKGFRSAKIKVGGSITADRERIKAVREAVGPDFTLRIDANAGYDADTAIELAHMLEPFELQLFEQPVPANDLAGMARVRREAGGIAIMADESVLDHDSLIGIIRAGAADYIKVKVMKQGGFLNTRRMISTAEAAGIRCVVGHGFGLGVNTIAEIMLASTSSNVIDGLECVGPLKTADDIITNRLDLSNGTFALPDGPGLGVTLDDEKLARYAISPSMQ